MFNDSLRVGIVPRPICVCASPPRLTGGRGFTLVELLTALVIVGILSAIAYPSYMQHIYRSNRAEVRGILLQDAQFLERNFTQNNRYDQDGNGAAVVLPFPQSPRSGAPKYTISVAFPAVNDCAGGLCYVLSARPVGAMAQDPCGTFRLTHTGAQDNIGSQPGWSSADCWQR